MPDNSPNDVFRFIQIRPPLPPDQPYAKLLDTELAGSLRAATTVKERVTTANNFLASSDAIRSLADAYLGTQIRDTLAPLRTDPRATIAELLRKLGTVVIDERFEKARRRLSDTLLATLLAAKDYPADLELLQDVYRVYDLVERAAGGRPKDEPLPVFLRRPIITPDALEPLPPVLVPLPPPPAEIAARVTRPEDLSAAATELASLARSRFASRAGEQVSFALRTEHRERLSETTRQVLDERGIDATSTALYDIVEQLENEWRNMESPRAAATESPGDRAKLPLPGPVKPFIRPSGLANLLVVKQHLKRYDQMDIAHIENVLAGEKKSRSHRRLERSEETITREIETTTEKKRELETEDQFELKRETSKTIRDSVDIGVDLKVSGKYGPSTEISSNFELDVKHAQEETTKAASTFAQKVVERSLERITERVREEIVRKLILETEETNLHELNNPAGGGGKHVRGVYQFLEKVYEAQVFDYGIRQLFDFMIPEPASFVWWMLGRPNNTTELPQPPPVLDIRDPIELTVDNYRKYVVLYGATDVDLPPPIVRRVIVGTKHGEDKSKGGEDDQPRSVNRMDVTLPSGYIPATATVRVSCVTDSDPVLSVTILDQTVVWKPTGGGEPLSAGHRMHTWPPVEFNFGPIALPLITDNKFAIETVMWESYSYVLEAVVTCDRTGEEYQRWKFETYKKIREAYTARMQEYDLVVQRIKAEAESRAARNEGRSFGRSPSENQRTVMIELKKHCLSTLTQQWFDTFDATNAGSDTRPPTFDLAEADEEGSYIRFFEQAFEWEQIQWIFYPYFWSRIGTWPDRFSRQDVDPLFRDFLQAGSARVVVPVRPGFELAITHFIETGKIWNGTGTPPVINSPLYVSIIDEIRERTAAPKGEIPVGQPWDVKVPTPLVLVRAKDDLPAWERVPGTDWEWRPVPEGP